MINTINALYVHIFHVAAINGRMADTVSNSSLDVSDIDLLSDAYSDKEVIRTKTFLFVADLARNGPRFHGKKTRLYMWNLIIVISHSFIDLANDFIHFILSRLQCFTLYQFCNWLLCTKTYVTPPFFSLAAFTLGLMFCTEI